jgi:hypothetical protein
MARFIMDAPSRRWCFGSFFFCGHLEMDLGVHRERARLVDICDGGLDVRVA